MTTKAASLAKYPTDQIVSSRVVANNTFEIIGPLGDKTIRLHFTDIVIFRPDGSIVLDSGGWRTVTTKARMNDFLPYGIHVYQQDGFWYLSGFYGSSQWTVPFYDGIVIPAGGSRPEPATSAVHDELLHYKKLINLMCKEADKLAKDRCLPMPSSGDCLLCSFERGDEMRKPGGNPLHNNHHILAHLEEQYLHGTLLYNAYLWAGYRHEQLQYVWGMRAGQILRRYLKARVGLS
jgi:hypothetical protein